MSRNRTPSQDRAYIKKRRLEAGRNGMCTTCCTRKQAAGKKSCRVCIDRAAERKRIAASPFCVSCAAFHPPGIHVVWFQILRRAA
jgi:hypothetical protein